MDLLHSTLPNGLQAFRLSCDTRWQPLDEAPPQGVQTGPWRAFHQGTLPEGHRSGKERMSKKMDDQENLVGGFNDFFIFTPIPGELIPNLTIIFQMGWFNHQLEIYVENMFCFMFCGLKNNCACLEYKQDLRSGLDFGSDVIGSNEPKMWAQERHRGCK